MTFGEVVAQYKATKVDARAKVNMKRTRAWAVGQLGRLTKYWGADTPVAEITCAKIEAWKASQTTNGNRPGTVDRALGTLQSLLNYARRMGVISVVPEIELYRLNDAREVVLSIEQEVHLLQAAAAYPHLYELILFYLDTGARRSEALQLTWSHVVVTANGGQVVFALGKAGKRAGDRPRTVPLTPRVAQVLWARKDGLEPKPTDRVFDYDPESLRASNGRRGRGGRLLQRWTPDKPVGITQPAKASHGWQAWIRHQGTKYHLGSFKTQEEAVRARQAGEDNYRTDAIRPGLVSVWRAATAAAGLRKLRLHDLRHTYASRLVSAGIPLNMVQALLGHADITQTTRYAHFAPTFLMQTAAVLDKMTAGVNASVEALTLVSTEQRVARTLLVTRA
jgi:integrase